MKKKKKKKKPLDMDALNEALPVSFVILWKVVVYHFPIKNQIFLNLKSEQ